MRRWAPPVIPVRIADPPDTVGRRVRVTVAATGKELRLPLEEIDILPGHVLLPAWLARKLARYLGEERSNRNAG